MSKIELKEIFNANEEEIIGRIGNCLKNIKINSPLVHCITNFVTVNDCANALLSVGASPIMAEDEDEMEDIISISNGLLLNIGTLNKKQIKSMHKATISATQKNIPIIFDPVGAGISKLRNNTTIDFLTNDYNITIIRGNMSEVKAVFSLVKPDINLESKAKGVDVSVNDIITKENIQDNASIVKNIAKELNKVIVASGPIDIISDGIDTFIIENGDEIMTKITGSGCMLSAIIAGFNGANDALYSAITGSLVMSLAGEIASGNVKNNNLGTGSFRSLLIDELYKMNIETIRSMANLYKIEGI